jgi:hypothetical protein
MFTDHWTLILGVILLALIFFLPEGVFGFLAGLVQRRKQLASWEER